ncbi:MAG: arsenite methyltransferase [Ignavibacteriae bacterium]|nr:arsenite methyltransferase [Ignavibacteriota bacterium]
MQDIKEVVKEKYSKIAIEVKQEGCCGSEAATTNCMAENYNPEEIADVEIANLGLGCGTPTAFADLKEGMTVLDLGSGAGIDVFIASKYVGSTGKVIGLDMTQEMIARAEENAKKLGITNVAFKLGEIEKMPIESATVDRVISNCVLNLVPDKGKAFVEIYRVLKTNGEFIISDIVSTGTMPDDVRKSAELWAGCVAGAMDKDEYLALIKRAGFKEVQILKEKKYDEYSSDHFALLSVTIRGKK